MFEYLEQLNLTQNELKLLRNMCSCYEACRFKNLASLMGNIPSGSLSYLLNKLEKKGLIKKISEGIYKLQVLTPFCVGVYNVPHKYIGALGLRQGRDKPEPLIALELLNKLHRNININERFILTTHKAISEWESFDFKDFELKMVYEDELLDIFRMLNKIEELVKRLMREGVIIADCTSLNKIYTIAMYNIAARYGIPLIYVYETKKKLIWLIGIEQITNTIIK